MKVINSGDRVWLPAADRHVDAGESVEVADEVGRSLVEQGWRTASAAKPRKAKAATKKQQTPRPAPADDSKD